MKLQRFAGEFRPAAGIPATLGRRGPRVASRGCRNIGKNLGTTLAHGVSGREPVMSYTITRDGVLSVLEHLMFVVAGFVLMVVGLGMGVTMVMLPVGLVVGLLGLAMFIGGLFVRMKDS
jgi:hypothetical protein